MSAPIIFELRGKRVYVAGHAGMVGAAIVRRLDRENYSIACATGANLICCSPRRSSATWRTRNRMPYSPRPESSATFAPTQCSSAVSGC
jgi:hypothetical protein